MSAVPRVTGSGDGRTAAEADVSASTREQSPEKRSETKLRRTEAEPFRQFAGLGVRAQASKGPTPDFPHQFEAGCHDNAFGAPDEATAVGFTVSLSQQFEQICHVTDLHHHAGRLTFHPEIDAAGRPQIQPPGDIEGRPRFRPQGRGSGSSGFR